MGVGGKIAILLNGPPRAGKDTAVAALESAFGPHAETLKFTRPIKDLTHSRFGLDCSHDAFEDLKDVPLPEFGGMTPREAYIDTSAKLKAERGDDAVCRLFVEAIDACNASLILNPDAGNDMEAEAVAEALGADRVLVIRIHRDGHYFSQCCRTWISSPSLHIVDVTNREGERRVFESEVVALSRAFVETVRARDAASCNETVMRMAS